VVVVAILMVLVALAVLVALRGLVVMLLWNWVMPVIFSLPELSFMHAVGLSLLVSFLIGFNSPTSATSTKKASK